MLNHRSPPHIHSASSSADTDSSSEANTGSSGDMLGMGSSNSLEDLCGHTGQCTIDDYLVTNNEEISLKTHGYYVS